MKKSFLVIVVLALCFWSIFGLIKGYLKGPESVGLLLGSFVIGIIISQIARITELQIGGNVVKLKAEIAEAHKALKTTFEVLLDQSMNMSSYGGLGDESNPKDPRIDFFFVLLEHIEKAGLSSDMKEKISEVASFLEHHQKRRFVYYYIRGIDEAEFQESVDNKTNEELKKEAESTFEVTVKYFSSLHSLKDYTREDIRELFDEAYSSLEKLSRLAHS